MYKEYENLIFDNITDINVFHALDEREYWEGLKEVIYEPLLRQKEFYDNYTFEPLYASLYMEFHTKKNRTNYEEKQFHRRKALNVYALLEAIENEGKHIMKILDIVWMTLEETQWALPAHCNLREGTDALPYYKNPILCLFSATLGAQLAFVYFLFREKFDKLSDYISVRIKEEVLERVVYEYLERDYGYTGLMPTARGTNNWTSAVNIGVLIAAIIFEEDKKILSKIVAKITASTVQQLSNYPDDGACDEGPSYWIGAVSNLSCVLKYIKELTNGAIDLISNEKTRNISNYFTVMYIYDSYAVSFADSDAVKDYFMGTLYQIGQMLENPNLISIVSDAYKSAPKPIKYEAGVNVMASIIQAECIKYFSKNPDIPSYKPRINNFLESIQVVSAHQTERAKEGLFFAAKGGNNGEYHNHNDVGNFIVYKNGQRFLCDSGRATYTAETFSDNRYILWQNRSMYHNLPVINGYEQFAKDYSKEYSAENVVYEVDGTKIKFSLDINNCYENKNDIIKWHRSFVFDREKGEITVREEYKLKKCESIVLNFISAVPFKIEKDAILMVAETGEELKIFLNLSLFDINSEKIYIGDDSVLKSMWKDNLYHIQLNLREPQLSGTITYVIR